MSKDDDFTMPDEDAFEAIAEKHDKHDPLERFEGKYKAEIKMYIGPGDPIEIEGTMPGKRSWRRLMRIPFFLLLR